MKERFLLFVIIAGLTLFIYIYQNYFNTVWGLALICVFMLIYGVNTNLAYDVKKRIEKIHPEPVNENYKPFVTIMIPAHNEESVISNTVANLFNIVFIQLGACISIIVGQHLGAGELEEAKDADNKMIVFSVFCCTIMAIIMFACGGLFPQIYNVDAHIRSLATSFIHVLSKLININTNTEIIKTIKMKLVPQRL